MNGKEKGNKEERLQVAVIGAAGVMGRNHCRVYSELKNCKITALVDLNLGGDLTTKYNCRGYKKYEDLPLDSFDAVSICTPTKTHFEVAKYFLSKGKHCLVEKPLCLKMDDAISLEMLARKHKAKLMVGHIERFNPAFIKLYENLDKIGTVRYIRSIRSSPTPIRISDVGVTEDLIVHDLDIINFIMRKEPKRKYKHSLTSGDGRDSMTNITLDYGNSFAFIHADWVTPKVIRQLLIVGTKGAFFMDYLTQDLTFVDNINHIPDFLDYQIRLMQVGAGDSTSYHIKKEEPLKRELSHFIDCCLNNTEIQVPTLDAYNVLKVLEKLEVAGPISKE